MAVISADGIVRGLTINIMAVLIYLLQSSSYTAYMQAELLY